MDKAEMIKFLKENLKVNTKIEYGYYGEIAFKAVVTLDGVEVASDFASGSSDYCSCNY